MVVKEFRELRRDRRTMAMLIALPILLLVIFGYAASFNVTSIPTVVTGPAAEQVSTALPGIFDVTDVDASATAQDAQDDLQDGRAQVAVATSGAPSGTDASAVAYVNGASLFTAQAAVSAIAQMNLATAGSSRDAVQVDVLYNPDLTTSWVMVPALVGLILAFIGTIITSLGLVRERQEGTLEQLAVMPFKPSDVILGKIAPYFLLAAVDMVLVTVLGMVLFDVPFNGSPLLFGASAAIFLLVVLGIGVLISTTAQNQGQAVQTAMLVLMPQILLSGMIFPLSAMPWGVRWIGYLLPLTYFINLSQGVMLRGAPFSATWFDVAILVVMAAVVLTAAILRFRRDLAPNIAGPARPEAAGQEDPGTGASS
jgi:ABC-2 type transport system permease protein